MGYRSQIRCLIYGEPEKLDTFITAHSLIEGSRVFQYFHEHLTRYSSTACYTIDEKIQQLSVHVLDLYGDLWKWYEDYEDVQAWDKFMKDAPNWELDYEFIRVGEEQGDVEIHVTNHHHNFLYLGTPPIIADIAIKAKFDIYGKPLKEDA